MIDPISAKAAMRREMRALRRALPDQAERSDRLWQIVRTLPEVERAGSVMVFSSVPGEPSTSRFIEWCHAGGKRVVLPEDEPAPDPGSIDVVIVPGLAFTVSGDRLGQGGGWYDRFIERLRPDSTTIGVCFEPQVVEAVPVEAHDRSLDFVVSDGGRCAT